MNNSDERDYAEEAPNAKLLATPEWDLFDQRSGAGYRFVCPGVMIGGGDLDEELVRDGQGGHWRLTQTLDDRTWVSEASTRVGAYLALIGARYGLDVTTREAKP